MDVDLWWHKIDYIGAGCLPTGAVGGASRGAAHRGWRATPDGERDPQRRWFDELELPNY